jgi:hypothetical protein
MTAFGAQHYKAGPGAGPAAPGWVAITAPYVLSLIAALGALALYRWDNSALVHLTSEDGAVDYLTALLYLAGAAVFAVLVIRGPGGRFWFAGFALMFFLIAGEEISWGQRIFGIGTPESLESANVQQELNLHNIEGLHTNVRLIGTAIFLGLYVMLPILVRVVAPLRSLVTRLGFPIPPLWATWLAVISLAIMVGTRVLSDGVIFELDEIGELFFAVAALVFALATLSVSRRQRRAAVSTAS